MPSSEVDLSKSNHKVFNTVCQYIKNESARDAEGQFFQLAKVHYVQQWLARLVWSWLLSELHADEVGSQCRPGELWPSDFATDPLLARLYCQYPVLGLVTKEQHKR